jgi:TonB-linked SusC/RagA family outer membrane protein
MKVKKLLQCMIERPRSIGTAVAMLTVFFLFSVRVAASESGVGKNVKASQQTGRTVTGTVIDESGELLTGASVMEKSTTNGIITDLNGKFTLNVSEGAILVISYIGYLTQEIPTGNATDIRVVLKEDSKALEEVVVIGYGTQRARDVTTSVANIQMNNIKSMPVSGVDQALTGQVAGVQINSSNGIPGGGPQIKIRGLGAVGADNQPLYVIDGFPLPSVSNATGGKERSNPINDIPPQDIASITILKDASATAIYGSRGANGVILVTTHRGRSGAPRVQVTAYTGISEVLPQEKPNMMNATEFATFQKERYEDNGVAVPEIYRNPEQYGKGTDWFEELTRIAPVNEVNLSVSGGNEKITSYFSAGYLDQQGVVRETGYQRLSLRTNVDAQLGKIKLGLSMAPSISQKKRDVNGGDGRNAELGWTATTSPIGAVKNPDGSWNQVINDGPGSAAWNYSNPVQRLYEIDQQTKAERLIGSLFGEWEIIPDLKFKTSFNADWWESNFDQFVPSTITSTINADRIPQPSVPSSRIYHEGYFNYAIENTLTYRKKIGDHSLDALLGYTFQKQTSNSSDFNGNDYTGDEVQTMNAAARIGSWGSSISDWSLISYIARVSYNYHQKYMATATVRMDGSSRFGQQNRWGTFPSASLGWRLSDEDFLKEVSWISDLKLRTSYGLAGNFSIGDYTYMSQVTTANYILNNALAGGRRMNAVGNPYLGWERVFEWNLGGDFGFFNDRILLLVDYYRRNTRDLLLDVEIPSSSGYSTAKENNGDLQNTGIEFTLTTRNISKADFSWTTGANIAFNRNKVIALGRGNASITSGFSGEQNPTHISIVGKPLAMFYGYRVEGIYTEDDFIKNEDGSYTPKPGVAAFPGAIPGNIRMKDVDGSGNITPVNDYEIIGNPYPDFTWGMSNVFTYRNWDLRIQMTGSVGGQLMKTQYEYTHNIDGIFNVTKDMANRYRSPQQPGDGRTPTTAGSSTGRVIYRDVNSDWILDNDYLWFKNITLGYTMSNIAKVISSMRIYFSLQNALLFTGYDGNPEVTNYGNSGSKAGALVPGVDYTTYPVPRIYTLGLNISF